MESAQEVMKSSLGTKVRRECSVRQVQARLAVGSITAPPPPPGSRTLGSCQSPMQELLAQPSPSICAAPRKVRSMRPRVHRS